MKQPKYKLQAQNHWRYIAIALLLLLAAICFYFSSQIGSISLIVGLLFLVPILFISFPKIEVNENHFLHHSHNVFGKKANQYDYKDLEEVTFQKGSTNWVNLFLNSIFMNGQKAYTSIEQNSSVDRMVLRYKNGNSIEIPRLGNREKFIYLVDQIQKNIV